MERYTERHQGIMAAVYLRAITSLLHAPPLAARLPAPCMLACGRVATAPLGVPSPLRTRTAALHGTRMQFDSSDGMGYDGGSYEPSEKQVRYAQQLAQRAGLPLPQEALVDRDRCSAFIEQALGLCAPSAKQVAFAESLAAAKNEPLSSEARASAKAISEYIDQNMQYASGAGGGGGGGGGGGAATTYGNVGDARLPSDKQLLYAAALARQNRVGLSYELLIDRTALSRFIDDMRAGPGGPPGGGGYNPAQYQANLGGGMGGMGGGMGVAASAGVIGGAFAGGDLDGGMAAVGPAGGDGSALDDLLTSEERGGSPAAAPAAGADGDLTDEVDDLFGPSTAAEGEDNSPLLSEGQIPF